MERKHAVPVQSAQDSPWPESGCLAEDVFIIYPKFKPGFAGKAHFGKEQQAPLLTVGKQYPPEIQGIPRGDTVGVRSAPAEAYPPVQLV